MTSIVELFPKSRKLAYDARQQLSQVQNGTLYASELFLSLDELQKQLDIMDNLLYRETASQRDMWNYKIQDLREQERSIRKQGEFHDRMVSANILHQRERNELLSRRRVRNNGLDDNRRDMDNLVREDESLSQSRSMVLELIDSGSASLNSLVTQRSRLKGVKRVMLDIGNKLGLSNSTMRIIERRDVTDAYLVMAGMVITLLVIYLLWF